MLTPKVTPINHVGPSPYAPRVFEAYEDAAGRIVVVTSHYTGPPTATIQFGSPK